MSPLLILFLIIVITAAAIWYFVILPKRRAAAEGDSLNPGQKTVASTPAGGIPLTPDLQNLKPGDAVSFWDGSDATVRGSFDCREVLNSRTTEWRWVSLSGDRLLEVLPRGQILYDSAAVAHQGDEFYDMLVGPGGSLKRFEGNVREGIGSVEPVTIDIDGIEYRIRSTGTFGSTQVGDLPEQAEVWMDISEDPNNNVYFKFARADGSDDKDVGLGIWTTHVLILRGRAIDRSDIVSVFSRGA